MNDGEARMATSTDSATRSGGLPAAAWSPVVATTATSAGLAGRAGAAGGQSGQKQTHETSTNGALHLASALLPRRPEIEPGVFLRFFAALRDAALACEMSMGRAPLLLQRYRACPHII